MNKELLKKELMDCFKNITEISEAAKGVEYIGSTRINLNSINTWYKRAMKLLDKIEFGCDPDER